MLNDVASVIAAISSVPLMIHSLYKEFKTRPRIKINGNLERPVFWMSYERDLSLGKPDRFGVKPYKVFSLAPNTSKVLRTGIKASSERSSIEVVIKCGKLEDRKVIQSITNLTFPTEPLPISAKG